VGAKSETPKHAFGPEDFLRVSGSRKGEQREVIEYAYNLRSIAQFLATSTPILLEVALGFDKVVEFINPLLHKIIKVSGELNSTFAELEEVRLKCEKLESDLQMYVQREQENNPIFV
jgi:hypothetical protein